MFRIARRTPSPLRSFLSFSVCLALLAPHVGAAPWMASGGSGHTQVLDGDGRVWVWGYNKYGVVGDGGTVDAAPHAQATPKQASLENVV